MAVHCVRLVMMPIAMAVAMLGDCVDSEKAATMVMMMLTMMMLVMNGLLAIAASCGDRDSLGSWCCGHIGK